jgi:tetratricopeptide (TPR) repeat protein
LFQTAANIYEKVGNDEKALLYYEKAIALNPDGNERAYNNAGVLFFRKNNLHKAELYYKKAISLGGEQPEYLENMAILYRKKGNTAKAIEWFEKLLVIESQNARAQNDLGVLYYGQGDDDQAIVHYKKAIELAPSVSLYYENLGIAYQTTGDNQEAQRNFEKALSLDPTNDRLKNFLGNICYSNGQYEAAIRYYEAANLADKKNAILVENMALALKAMGKNEEEKAVLHTLVGLNPEHGQAWSELGLLASKAGNYPEAITSFQKSLSLSPESAFINEEIAICYEAIDDRQTAMEHFKRSAAGYEKEIKRDPADKLTLMATLADLYLLRLEQPAKASALYEQVLKERPNDTASLSYLAEAYAAVNDTPNAERIRSLMKT